MSAVAEAPPSQPPAVVRTQEADYGIAKVRADVTYSRDGSQLDVYKPTRGPTPPGGFTAIVAIPGGGWKKIDRGDYGASVVGAFVPYGYVVVPADYLYASDGARSWPGAVEDVRAAVRWVRKNADKLDVNPDKVVVSGESAGAHLASLAGVLPAGGFDPGNKVHTLVDSKRVSGKPDAVVDFFGPTDLTDLWRERPQGRSYLQAFMGGSLKQYPGRYAAASPLNHVTPDDPPTFIIQGDADKIIPVPESVAFHDALANAGVETFLTIIHTIPHGFRFHIGPMDLGSRVRAFLSLVLDDK